MPSDKEIEVAAKAIADAIGNGMREKYLTHAKAALQAAEQERQDIHTELVGALEYAVGIAEDNIGGTWDDLIGYRGLLNKVKGE